MEEIDWKARAERAETLLRIRDRQIETARKYWIIAAKEALAGDTRTLRNRVDMAEAPPVEIVLSA